MIHAHRRILAVPMLCLLGLFGACADARLGTETGNPPVLSPQKLQLEGVEADGVRLVGEPGAVRPGNVTVEVTNVSRAATSVTIRADAEGAFVLLLPGTPEDAYYLVAIDEMGRRSQTVTLGAVPKVQDVLQIDGRLEVPGEMGRPLSKRMVGDMDGDGLAELVVPDQAANVVHLFYGSSSLREGVDLKRASATFCGATHVYSDGDVDGDGLTDLLLYAPPGACDSEDLEPGLYLVRGSKQRLTSRPSLAEVGTLLDDTDERDPTFVGDFDCDGADDLIYSVGDAGEGSVLVSGRGVAERGVLDLDPDDELVRWALPPWHYWGVGDLDADGCDDLLGQGDDQTELYYGRRGAAGELDAAATLPGQSHRATAGDFDGDGRRDLASGSGPVGASKGEVLVFFGTGRRLEGDLGPEDADVHILPERSDDPGRFLLGPAGDFDGDGRDDLPVVEIDDHPSERAEIPLEARAGALFVVLGAGGSASTSLGEGNLLLRGRAEPPVTTVFGEERPREVIEFPFLPKGDLDGDGFDELMQVAYRNGGDSVTYLVFGGWKHAASE